MKNFWACLHLLLLAVACFNAIGLIYLFGVHQQVQFATASTTQMSALLATAKVPADVLSYALQLGRLDFVSMSLTCLGGAVAIFGLAGFWMVRREAIDESQKATKDFLRSAEGKHQVVQLSKGQVEEFLRGKEGLEIVTSVIKEYFADSKELASGQYSEKTLQDVYDEIAKDSPTWRND